MHVAVSGQILKLIDLVSKLVEAEPKKVFIRQWWSLQDLVTSLSVDSLGSKMVCATGLPQTTALWRVVPVVAPIVVPAAVQTLEQEAAE